MALLIGTNTVLLYFPVIFISIRKIHIIIAHLYINLSIWRLT